MSSGAWDTIKQRIEAKMKLNMAKTKLKKYKKVYNQLNQQVKKEVRRDKRRWIDNQAQKAEEAAKQGNMEKLYDTRSDGKRQRILNRDITKNEGKKMRIM
jgi:hypothetical protein